MIKKTTQHQLNKPLAIFYDGLSHILINLKSQNFPDTTRRSRFINLMCYRFPIQNVFGLSKYNSPFQL